MRARHGVFPLLLAPALIGCEGALSTLDPAGPAAQSIAGVWWVMMAGSLLILGLMMGLILWPFFKRHQPREVPEKLWLWGGGLGFPLVVLAALLAWGLPAGQSMLAGRGAQVYTVEAEAFQWGWNFRYPDREGITPEVLHIPAGEPVDVAITSLDVIHAFWVPRLAGKVDAIPGTTNRLRILASEPGVYEGMCAEFCGLEHATMRFQVVAHAPDEFEAALTAELAGQGQP
ncbi:cytochrome c oxidase subunit II [Glycocaulis sp.]|uniref:cytochrome c oxidase subunit II n=1 Tax=Glycocaulis sp. TaxID=1969725 RepID=UPI003D20871D